MNHNSVAGDSIDSKIEKVQCCDIFWILFSIFAFILDFVLDIKLAVNFFQEEHVWFFAQTVFSIIVPSLILSVFNIWWYDEDAKANENHAKENSKFKASFKLLIVRQLLIFLLMAPLLRDFEALYCAIKSIRSRDGEKKYYYKRMKSFACDAAMLRVFEAFMEGGPQVVLQLYIFAQSQATHPSIITGTEITQMVLICSSVASMAFTYASYQRSLRFCLKDKKNLNIPIMLFIVVWRLFDITSRVLALSLFASIFPYYLLMICCAHFIAMFIWIRTMETKFYDTKCKEFIYNLVLAEIFVFIYFNPIEQAQTRRCYAVYYILNFFENTVLICLWFYYYSPVVALRLPAFILQFLSFVIAIALMVIYYYFLHPVRGKIGQKTTEIESKIEMGNYETPSNPEEKENMITDESTQ